MMGAPDDGARAVSSTGDQVCVVDMYDDNETDEAENELSPSCPEAMLRDVAKDAAASIEYDQRVPRAFSQLGVEAAFQARYTDTRLTVVTSISVGSFFFLAARIVEGLLSPGPSWNVPLSIPVGMCIMLFLTSLGLLCTRTKLRESHHAMHVFSSVSYVAAGVAFSGMTLISNSNGGPANPFGTAYTSGVAVAGATLCMAHNEAPLWTFLFNLLFAVTVSITPGAGMMPAIATIASALILGSVSRQIMMQHRHLFVSEVRQSAG